MIDFLAGVIEGFYGQPWSQAERFELFDWMGRWGLNTYLYAPKDDLKHRVLWREPYSADETEKLGQLLRACKEPHIRFIYALSPGLDIRCSDDAELGRLKKRFGQMMTLGCHDFCLLFDDIPGSMNADDMKRWGSLALAQCHVTNVLFKWTQECCPGGRFLFCPTAYCGRMAKRNLGGEAYLATVGRELLPEIDIFWTGPEIVSQEITVDHVRELTTTLRRKPIIWDNLHANDYDGRRFFCGPYTGRSSQLLSAVSGLMSNPNNEFPLNYVPIRTLAEFVRCPQTERWDSRKAWLSAMREWLPYFKTVGQPVTLEDLVAFGDCYYLPHEEGPEAEALYQRAKTLLARDPAHWGERAELFRKEAARLREFCVRMTELTDRRLFYALSRRIWELREELDLLVGVIDDRCRNGDSKVFSASDSHLPGTYRGGIAARLQRLLEQQTDGSFAPCGGVQVPVGDSRTQTTSAP